MKFSAQLFGLAVWLATCCGSAAVGQDQQVPANVPTFRVKSNLVFLDVTVLDKKGRPTADRLNKDDFTITEDNKTQNIFSFEPPQEHVSTKAEDDDLQGKAPLTIFVLDQLNSSYVDFQFLCNEMSSFLSAQPRQLPAPAELMVIGNESLEMVQGYTRSRADLLAAMNHVPRAMPYKVMLESFFWERFVQSLDALQQIALQNQGVPGRKNVVWLGHGGPSAYLRMTDFSQQERSRIYRYVHSTTNLLVASRISLFVIYPGVPSGDVVKGFSAIEAEADHGDRDPFAGDVSFGFFVNETGGQLFYNHNDVDEAVKRTVRMGEEYYTLTYQPTADVEANDKFRRVRVTLRDPNLRAMTKTGYYAPAKDTVVDQRQQRMTNIAQAMRSSVPLETLALSLSDIVRHPEAESAELTVELKSKNINFSSTEDGQQAAQLILAAASLDKHGRILVSKMEPFMLRTRIRDQGRLPEVLSRFRLTIRVPRRTDVVRVIVENQDGGQVGAADVPRRAVDAAPAMAASELEIGSEFARPVPSAKQ